MNNNDIILHDTSRDGIDRRGFLRCMGWAGTAVVCSISGRHPDLPCVGGCPGQSGR